MKIVRARQGNTMRAFMLVFTTMFWAASNVTAQNAAQYNLAQSIEKLSFNQDQAGLRKDGTVDFRQNPFHQTRFIKVDGCTAHLHVVHELVAGKYDVIHVVFDLTQTNVLYSPQDNLLAIIGFEFYAPHQSIVTHTQPNRGGTFETFLNQPLESMETSVFNRKNAAFWLYSTSNPKHSKDLVNSLREYQSKFCQTLG